MGAPPGGPGLVNHPILGLISLIVAPLITPVWSCVGKTRAAGLVAGYPLWCFSSWRDVVVKLDPVERLIVGCCCRRTARSAFTSSGGLGEHRCQSHAGGHHARRPPGNRSPAEAQVCLRAGRSAEETLRSASAMGSFRIHAHKLLATMLDGIGLAQALGLESAARLFDTITILLPCARPSIIRCS